MWNKNEGFKVIIGEKVSMKNLKFNLSKSSMGKKSMYDGGSPQVKEMTRMFSNCQKAKLDKGMGAQEAWQSCLEEYQKNKKNKDWTTKYAKSNKVEKK